MAKNLTTAKIRKAQARGHRVLAMWATSIYGELSYSPRTKYDPKPWLSANGYRFNATELYTKEP